MGFWATLSGIFKKQVDSEGIQDVIADSEAARKQSQQSLIVFSILVVLIIAVLAFTVFSITKK